MSFLRKILYILLLLPLLAAPACSSDGPDVPDTPSEPEVAGYLQLTVSTAGNPASRTADSEDGDGREPGNDNESAIHNLTVFAYIDRKDGLDGNYDIVWQKFITSTDTDIEDDNPSLPLNRIYLIKIPLNDEDFRALRVAQGVLRCAVVANAGDLTGRYRDISTLTFNTDAYASAWTQDEGVAKKFVMSSAFNGAKRIDRYRNDGRIFTSQSNEEGVIYYGEVTLERVAARIDFQFSKDENEVKQNGDKTLTYKVKGTETENMGAHTVTLLNIIPINVMQQNSYLFKHLSGNDVTLHDVTLGHYIAADETRTADTPDNFVYSPSFFEKMTASNTTLGSWFGDTHAPLFEADPSLCERTGKLSDYGESFEADDMNTITLTYANENTHPAEAQVVGGSEQSGYIRPSRYITGILFRAQYHPSIVYTGYSKDENGEYQLSYTEYNDGDFWLCREIKEGRDHNLYFADLETCKAYIDNNPDHMFETPVLYRGGICFYNVWLKHNIIDDPSTDNYPMKYGIVRNNIYRLSVSFKNIGKPIPDTYDPEFEIEYIISVIPWRFGGKVHINDYEYVDEPANP